MNSKPFHISDVLSITTGAFVSADGIGGIYRILGWMTGEELFTHQLPRAQDQCQGFLREQHPHLPTEMPPQPDGGWTRETVDAWVAEVADGGPTMLDVVPLPDADRAPQDPIEELCDMVGPDRVYVVPEVSS